MAEISKLEDNRASFLNGLGVLEFITIQWESVLNKVYKNIDIPSIKKHILWYTLPNKKICTINSIKNGIDRTARMQ